MSQVADKRYANWVKDTLSLLYVKEGLEVFIGSQSANFHGQLKAALGHNTCPCGSLDLARGSKGWVVKHCNGQCQAWLNRILSHHRLKPPIVPKIVPGNVKPNLWPTDYWEVMKLYQPKGCQDHHSASDADIAALLDLMNNCDHFFPFYNHGHHLINEVMCIRNKLMHSSDFLVEDSALTFDVQKMLTFLRNLTSLSATESQPVQAAVDKITQLNAKVLDLTLNRELELKALKASQTTLQNEMKNLQQTVTNVTMDTAATRSDLTTVQDKVDKGILDLHEKVVTEVDGLKDKVSDIQDKVDTDIASLQGKMEANVKGLHDKVDTKVKDLDSKVDTKVQELDEKVDTKVKDLDDKVRTKVQALDDKVDTKVKDLDSKVATNTQKLDDKIGTKMKDLDNKVDTNVQQLDNKVQGLQGDMDTKVSGLHDKVDKEIQDLQQRLAVHTSRIQELQKELSTQHQSTQNTLFSLTNLRLRQDYMADDLKQVKEKQDSMTAPTQRRPMTPREVQSHLIELYSQTCQKIPIYPLRPEWKQHVARFFVLPSMMVTSPRGLPKDHLLKINTGSNSFLTKLQDIFANTGSRCPDIYILGDAGTGKSCLCEYLVHLWVSCHTSSNQVPDSEEKIMQDFDYLFYISLREATSCNVEDMIKNQLQLEGTNVSKIIYDYPSLIILDGLDEYTQQQHTRTRFSSKNVPYRRHSDKCTVLTTSRPWKIELLTKELEDKIDRQISIVGLDTESQKKLVGNVVDVLNLEKSGVKDPADFILEAQTQQLDKFMKTPVLLVQMLGLWFSGEPLGGSQCSIYAKLIDKQIQFAKEVRDFPTDPQCQVAAAEIPDAQHDDETSISEQDPFSTFFKNNTYILSYKTLLLKLSMFAYCSLSSKDRENSLVFNHEQMELFDMSREEIRLCLHLGLLTQYKIFGEITQRLKALSFIHKSHQEFFAAIFLSQIEEVDDLIQLLEQDFPSLGDILEMGTVFKFVCGMNPNVACEISRFIMDKASTDPRLEQYRQYGEDWYTSEPNTALVRQLQSMILVGLEEGSHNGHEITDMQLQDIFIDATDRDFPPARVIACTGSLDLLQVKSLYIENKGALSRPLLQPLLENGSKQLEKLVLKDTVVSVEMIQKVVQRQQGRLQTLGLINPGADSFHVSQLNHTDLQAILLAPTKSLLLHDIVLTHSQLEFLCQQLSNSCYGEVDLGWLKCTTHEYDEDACKQCLDLSASRDLSRLALWKFPLQEVLFVPENLVSCEIGYLPVPVATSIISSLKRAERLERLRCYSLGASTVNELSAALPRLKHLQNIVLYDMILSGQQQIVRAVAQLKDIWLSGVFMRDDDLQELLSALPFSDMVLVRLGGSRPVAIIGYNRQTDPLEQIRCNPCTIVFRDNVKFEGYKCIVKQFWFFTKK